MKRSPLPSRKTPIRRVSDKQRKRMAVIAKLRRERIRAFGPWCELRLEGCTGREQGIHHILKKSAGGQDTHENTVLACNACNMAVEDRPIEARERGLSRRRNYSDSP